MELPLFVPHYSKNIDRRAYLDKRFAQFSICPQFVTEFDRENFAFDTVYCFDVALYKEMIEPIKDILMGYVLGLVELKTSPWASCVALQRRKNLSLDEAFERNPWLRPRPLNEAKVSIFLKHRAAWEKIIASESDWAIIAEDDIIFDDHSIEYLREIVENMPNDFDYIDLAGGCGLLPRTGNRVVNKYFFEMDPPRDRTVCCAILRRCLVRRLLEIAPPICLPIDWTLTYAFTLINAKVYWLEPLVFGHGSQSGDYIRSIRMSTGSSDSGPNLSCDSMARVGYDK